jgi:thiol:disulfide interchange protein
MRLSIPAAALPNDLKSVVFFADEWGLLEHAAPQDWRIDGDRLLMTLTPGEAPDTAAPTGLVVVETSSAFPPGSHSAVSDAAQDLVKLAFAVDASAGSTATSTAEGAKAAAASGPVGATAEVTDEAAHDVRVVSKTQAAAEGSALGLPLAIIFALFGGLILNLMPCVFPVLAIKALSLAQQGQQSVSERALHGLAYTAGVLGFFALVGLLLLALRAGGAAVGWGFQLQSPIFVVLMAYLFLSLGLSLSGAITLGTSLMGIGATGPTRGHLGAFATGGLAALVAAPCTAPFMGAALGFAIAQPWPAALSVMLALGLGMALPFLLLALTPAMARWLPRPGAWMDTLKQLLAFPMFATAAWLLWVLSVQAGPVGVGAGLAGAVLVAFALWLFEASRAGRGRWRRAGQLSAAVALASALWLSVALMPPTPASTSGASMELGQAGGSPELANTRPVEPDGTTNAGEGAGVALGTSISDSGGGLSSRLARARPAGPQELPYTPERLEAARAAGRRVFVNMTAAWCITCLVNERVALSRPAVAAAFAERDVLYLKGDWTNRDAAITHYLAGFGRSGVPLYVYYAPGVQPRILPQVLTESIVLNAL